MSGPTLSVTVDRDTANWLKPVRPEKVTTLSLAEIAGRIVAHAPEPSLLRRRRFRLPGATCSLAVKLPGPTFKIKFIEKVLVPR